MIVNWYDKLHKYNTSTYVYVLLRMYNTNVRHVRIYICIELTKPEKVTVSGIIVGAEKYWGKEKKA